MAARDGPFSGMSQTRRSVVQREVPWTGPFSTSSIAHSTGASAHSFAWNTHSSDVRCYFRARPYSRTSGAFFLQGHMASQDLVVLLHLAGFISGVVLYAMLAAMTLRQGRVLTGPGSGGDRDAFPLAAATLGLLWNSVALIVYGMRDFGLGRPSPWLVALGFVSLGFLPAAVVQSTVRPRAMGHIGRALVAAAYALSVVGGVLQLWGAAHNAVPSRPGLLTLSVGYAAILVALLAFGPRDRRGWRRSLFVIALAAFSLTALHLSQPDVAPDSWVVALVGHQASLPLVLIILYQDYRFAFADLFLRRALSLLALVTVAVSLHVILAMTFVTRLAAPAHRALWATVVQTTLWVLTALSYPRLRRMVGGFVDGVVLDRVDYGELRARLNAKLLDVHTPDEALTLACATLATALDARFVTWRVADDDVPASHPDVVTRREARDGATVRVPTADAPDYALDVSDLAPGRRLLSDDVALLEWVAVAAARRVDHMRLTHERYARDLREREILQLATEAELRELRAQLNPHFLFNALTTIGHLLQSAPERALETLYRLTSLLRFVLRRSTGEFVTLGEEVELIDAYLAIERARFEERLVVTLDVDESLRSLRIPPLILQPLVENAIKHGIAPLARGGRVSVSARLDGPSTSTAPSPALRLRVADDGVGIEAIAPDWHPSAGVGMGNIQQRLTRYYGDRARMEVRAAASGGTVVELVLPVETHPAARHSGVMSDLRTLGRDHSAQLQARGRPLPDATGGSHA
jgi:hypothetical protein